MIKINEVAHKGKILGFEIQINESVFHGTRENGLCVGEFPKIWDGEKLVECYKKTIFSC